MKEIRDKREQREKEIEARWLGVAEAGDTQKTLKGWKGQR